VLPVIQGTSENAAFRIIKNGFGTVASVDDGYYGRGMYFTSHLKYASRYAHVTPHGKVFIIALTIPGNVYPTTENPLDGIGSLLGQACKKGYQSHYVKVTKKGHPILREGTARETEAVADELVVFEGWQTLPLFLVYTSEFGRQGADADSGAQTAASSVPKGWNFLDQGFGENEEAVSTSQLEDLTIASEDLEENDDEAEEKTLLKEQMKKMAEEAIRQEVEMGLLQQKLKDMELKLLQQQQ